MKMGHIKVAWKFILERFNAISVKSQTVQIELSPELEQYNFFNMNCIDYKNTLVKQKDFTK